MISPADFYSLDTRAVKYGIQFLALPFMAVFCLELMSGGRVHPVQYLFTGIAMVFFSCSCCRCPSVAAAYRILYPILQLEGYALLAGAILRFVALTVVMFVTLRVDWSGGAAPPVPQRA